MNQLVTFFRIKKLCHIKKYLPIFFKACVVRLFSSSLPMYVSRSRQVNTVINAFHYTTPHTPHYTTLYDPKVH